MKPNTKTFIHNYWIVAILLVSAFFLNHCKSNGKKEPTAVLADTGNATVDTTSSTVPLIITINNLSSSTAPVVIGIYNSNNKFLYKESRLKEYTFFPKSKTLTARITGIAYGKIAVAVYQDMNSNDKFDKNSFGLPSEGYAFSNNFKPTLKAPDFDDCSFSYNSTMHTVTMKLIK